MNEQIEGVPEGWRLVRIGKPKAGEWFIGGQGRIEQWSGMQGHESRSVYGVIEKIVKYRNITPDDIGKMMDRKTLVETMAKICYYGQEHSRDWSDSVEKDIGLEHVSHIISCFVAQNTLAGIEEGCESFVILNVLKNKQMDLQEWISHCDELVDFWDGVLGHSI